MKKDLGTDVELIELVNRIRGFDFDDATPTELLSLSKALRVLADDTIARHQHAGDLEIQLSQKLKLAAVIEEMHGVVETLKPVRKGWLPWK